MSPNPFFSGRIPQKLFDAIEEYRRGTGESKTDVLVKALSAYINVPMEVQQQTTIQVNAEESKRLNMLENRMEAIELLMAELQQRIAHPYTLGTSKGVYSDVVPDGQMSLSDIEPSEEVEDATDVPKSFDNNADNETDNNSDEMIEVVEADDNDPDKSSDNRVDNEVDSQSKRIFIGRMKTDKIPSLPGLESEDPKRIKVKLNNTRNTKSQKTQIGSYFITLSNAVEASAKGKRQELLWDVYQDA